MQRGAAPVDMLDVNGVEAWKKAERRYIEVVRAGAEVDRWDAIERALLRWARTPQTGHRGGYDQISGLTRRRRPVLVVAPP